MAHSCRRIAGDLNSRSHSIETLRSRQHATLLGNSMQSAKDVRAGVATLSKELKLHRLIQGDARRESCNVAGMQARCHQLIQAGTCHP